MIKTRVSTARLRQFTGAWGTRPWFIAGLLAVLILRPWPAHAQEAPPDALIRYGEVVTGTLDRLTPINTFFFDGLRGDYVSLRVRPISGNLDPVLTVSTSDGRVLTNQDDSRTGLGGQVETLLIERSDRYRVVVAVFGYGLGSTAGSFELLLERIGNSPISGSALRYGDTLSNTISNAEPELFYSFRATQGDILNLTMQHLSGDLDPYLQIVQVIDGQPRVLIDSDDGIPGTLDARIEAFIIPQDGTYYIIATRYGQVAGTSTGNFLLLLEEAAESGQGISPQAALPLALGAAVDGTLDNETFERYYRFEAVQDDIVTIRMDRIEGDLDCYITLFNANLQPLTFDDDSGEGVQNSLIAEYRVPTTGTYYIVATRYQQADGITSGRYRLSLETAGNAFAEVPASIPRLAYDTSVTGTIDDITPQGRYVFFAAEADLVTVSLTRGDGDLAPAVTLVDASGAVLAAADAGGTPSAVIARYRIPASGLYYVVATREDTPGTPTSGSYLLVLARIVEAGS